MSRIYRQLPARGTRLAIAYSGGLDTRCAVAAGRDRDAGQQPQRFVERVRMVSLDVGPAHPPGRADLVHELR